MTGVLKRLESMKVVFPGGELTALPQTHRRRKWSVVGGHHGECGARAYNGGLGAESPAGSRGRAPGQGSGGQSPPETESILAIECATERANLAPYQKCPFELRYTQQSP